MIANLPTGLACVAMLYLAGFSTARGQSLPAPLPQAQVRPASDPAPAKPPKQATGRRPSAIPGYVFPKEAAYRPTSNPAAFSALQVRPFQLDGQGSGSRDIDPRRPITRQAAPHSTARFDSGVGLASRPEILRAQGNRPGPVANGGGMGMGGYGGSNRNPMSLGFFLGNGGGLGGAGNGFVLIGVR